MRDGSGTPGRTAPGQEPVVRPCVGRYLVTVNVYVLVVAPSGATTRTVITVPFETATVWRDLGSIAFPSRVIDLTLVDIDTGAIVMLLLACGTLIA